MDPDHASATSTSPIPSAGHTPAIRLSEFAEQFLLPRLLRAGSVAARPERIIAGFVSVLVILVVAFSLNGNPNEPGTFGNAFRTVELAVTGSGDALLRLDIPNLGDRARLLILETPRIAITEAPIASAVMAVVLAFAWGIPGLFIARGAGMEFGRRIHISLGRSFNYLRAKGPAAAVALLLAPFVAIVFLVVPLLLGLLLAVPGLDLLGGLVYGLGLLASGIAAFLMLAWIPASWLILPAVACDGADAFDATQRAYGMLLSRPLSVLIHLAAAVVQGIVLVGAVWILADLAVALAGATAGAFSDTAREIVIGAVDEDAGGTRGGAASMVLVWSRVPAFIAASYAVSYAHSASTAVYLNARKMVDGQEPSELWMPGDAAGIVEIDPPRADTADQDS